MIAIKYSPETVNLLSNQFSKDVRTELKEHLDTINKRNETYGEACATHDFCDANEIMWESFERVFGIELNFQDDDHMAITNAAWGTSKEKKFQ
ncbi:MAG: hypothetical protein HEP71_34310 [Roseivirga sp.]|nr:hypothetical protein [Roseivirga sp.]